MRHHLRAAVPHGPPPVAFGAREARELACASCLLRRRLEHGLTQATDLAITLQHETAAVERGQRRAMPDRYDRATLEPRVEETVERGFRRLVERSRRLVEE